MTKIHIIPIVKYEIDKEHILHIYHHMQKDMKEAKGRLDKEDYRKALTALENVKERVGRIKKEINKSAGIVGYGNGERF